MPVTLYPPIVPGMTRLLFCAGLAFDHADDNPTMTAVPPETLYVKNPETYDGPEELLLEDDEGADEEDEWPPPPPPPGEFEHATQTIRAVINTVK